MTNPSSYKVSVLMPAYNAEQFLESAAHSILNQTYRDIELLIIDDGSVDATHEIMERLRDSRVRLFRNEKNQGYLRSINYLLTHCRGDFIAFQDADDTSHPSRLAIQISAMRADSDLMFCGTQCAHTKNGDITYTSNFPSTHHSVVRQVMAGESVFLCGASVLVRRAMYTKYGGYREFYDRIGAEHIDWYLQMLVSEKFCNLSEVLYFYNQRDSSFAREMSLEPLKYHSTQVALLCFFQRCEGQRDSLSDPSSANRLKRAILARYERDNAAIYRAAGLNQLAFGHLDNYFHCVNQVIKINGFSWSAIQFALIWFPYAIFHFFLPRKVKRTLVQRRNIKFIESLSDVF